MSLFEKEKGQLIPERQPESRSFENVSHSITQNPIEVDLDQPDRAAPFEMERITGFSESKLIAQIVTPVGRVDVVHTQLETLDPVLMLVNENRSARMVIDPADAIDVSADKPTGKCIIVLDEAGKRLHVYASEPDMGYQIFTREIEQFVSPVTDYMADDPDYL